MTKSRYVGLPQQLARFYPFVVFPQIVFVDLLRPARIIYALLRLSFASLRLSLSALPRGCFRSKRVKSICKYTFSFYLTCNVQGSSKVLINAVLCDDDITGYNYSISSCLDNKKPPLRRLIVNFFDYSFSVQNL